MTRIALGRFSPFGAHSLRSRVQNAGAFCRTGFESPYPFPKQNWPREGAILFWRRGWDSNPRKATNLCWFSRPVHSTALPPLQNFSTPHGVGLTRIALGRFSGLRPAVADAPASKTLTRFVEPTKGSSIRSTAAPARGTSRRGHPLLVFKTSAFNRSATSPSVAEFCALIGADSTRRALISGDRGTMTSGVRHRRPNTCSVCRSDSDRGSIKYYIHSRYNV